MNFEERISVATVELMDFLERFKAPSGLSEDAKAKTIEAIAKAFARRLPISSKEEYIQNLARSFDRVADGHSSYAWPPQGDFVECMKFPGSSEMKAQETYTTDRLKNTADKMNANDAIAEPLLWGITAAALRAERLIDAETLERYRVGSARHWSSVYGPDAERLMASRYGDQVRAYFGARNLRAAQ